MAAFASVCRAPRLPSVLRTVACKPCAPRHRPLCSASARAATPRKTAAALIIGDEILNGNTLDTNTRTLATLLVHRGVELHKTETIRDDVHTICDTVRRLSAEHDMVFTSGGIGPTLDDVTYEGVACAFGLPLVRHEATVSRMRQIQPHLVLNEARLRMVMLPQSCDVIWTEGLWVPIAIVQNVYMLPGIPRLFKQMIYAMPQQLFGNVAARQRKVVWCDMAEGDLAATLTQAAKQYDVRIGSYPATTEQNSKLYRTMISVEGDVASVVDEASRLLIRELNGRYGHV